MDLRLILQTRPMHFSGGPPPPHHIQMELVNWYVMSFPNPNPVFGSWVELAVSQCMQMGVDGKNCSCAPPLFKKPPQTSVSGNTSPVNIGSHYPRTVVDQMNNHLVLFWGGFPLWRWNNSVSLNPVHVCGTRIWQKFTLKSSSIESSVMRCFFSPSFGVFPFCNKTFYWEELSPVDGSAVGKTPKEALKWVWFSNSSCCFAGSQRGERNLWWEECRAASIIIPDLGISMDMMKWNHCFWMQNKKSECFQVWQVF